MYIYICLFPTFHGILKIVERNHSSLWWSQWQNPWTSNTPLFDLTPKTILPHHSSLKFIWEFLGKPQVWTTPNIISLWCYTYIHVYIYIFVYISLHHIISYLIVSPSKNGSFDVVWSFSSGRLPTDPNVSGGFTKEERGNRSGTTSQSPYQSIQSPFVIHRSG